MAVSVLEIRYPQELLVSLKKTPEEFEAEAKILLAVKLYETGQVSTGMAARLAGLERVAFLFELDRFGLSPIGTEPDEIAQDLANA